MSGTHEPVAPGPGWADPPAAVAPDAPPEGRSRLGGPPAEVADEVLDRLGSVTSVESSEGARVEAGRDWWPLALHWARRGQVPMVPAAVARPASTAEVAAVLRICNEAGVPVTPQGGRSGVCGGAVPKRGGIALDLRGLDGVVAVRDDDLRVDVRAGTNGLVFEEHLRSGHGLTCGHSPQSIALSSVGGWLACRGAGQHSTRYGKVEDMVAGLEVVLADGTVVRTGTAPRAAVGPDLTQLFVGCEGALGVITEATLRVWPAPVTEGRSAWTIPSFERGVEVCRRILRRGATPAVLRLYDGREGRRFGGDGQQSVLLVLDEGDPASVAATLQVVGEECASLGQPHDTAEVQRWLDHRNDVSGLGDAVARGLVVDTCEVAAPWSALPHIYRQALAAREAVDGLWVVSAHQSHAYPDGACLYFTFAGEAPDGDTDRFHERVWHHLTRATLDNGGALSHHHGVGLVRAADTAAALGAGHAVLAAVKRALDPAGILNPGAFGLPSPFGPVTWPG